MYAQNMADCFCHAHVDLNEKSNWIIFAFGKSSNVIKFVGSVGLLNKLYCAKFHLSH